MSQLIYYDHAATTPMNSEVIDVMEHAMREFFGNPSSTHQMGRKSKNILNQARQTFSKSIGAKASEITITSGGTESDNTAILQTARMRKDEGKHIVTTEIEHKAVIESMKVLEAEGFEITYLPVDEKGRLTLSDLTEALREDTTLVSIMYVNNEVGTVMPVEKIGEIVQENSNAYFHTDAVQAYGLMEIDVERDHIDLLSVSAHKINGPKGIGFLYIREGINLPSYIVGGDQEIKKRAGTENVPAIAGFQKAVEIAQDNQGERRQAMLDYRKTFLKELDKSDISYEVNGSREEEETVGHILNLYLPGINSEQLLIQLDLRGISLSAGSACTAGNIDPSHVLVAMFGEASPRISESIRLSFGLGNEEEDIEIFIEAIKDIIE